MLPQSWLLPYVALASIFFTPSAEAQWGAQNPLLSHEHRLSVHFEGQDWPLGSAGFGRGSEDKSQPKASSVGSIAPTIWLLFTWRFSRESCFVSWLCCHQTAEIRQLSSPIRWTATAWQYPWHKSGCCYQSQHDLSCLGPGTRSTSCFVSQ